MSKFSLHISKIEQFKTWLDGKGLLYREGRGEYQVLQVKHYSKPEWYCIFYRLHNPNYYTVDHRLDALVDRFLKETSDEQRT